MLGGALRPVTCLARVRSCGRNRALVAGIKCGACELNEARRVELWLAVKFLGLLLVCYMPLAIGKPRPHCSRLADRLNVSNKFVAPVLSLRAAHNRPHA